MNYTKLPKKALLLLATPVLLSLAVPATRLMAQSQTETKIRLMAEALRARDNGDLSAAKSNLEQLLVLAPGDVTVQRLLAGVNASLAGTAPSPVEVVAVSETPTVVEYDPSGKPAKKKAASDSKSVTEGAAEGSAEPIVVDPALAFSKEETEALQKLVQEAVVIQANAAALAKAGKFDHADSELTAALETFKYRENVLTQPTINALKKDKNGLLLQRSQALLAAGDIAGAKTALEAYIAATSAPTQLDKGAAKQAAQIEKAELNPVAPPLSVSTPKFHPEQMEIARMQALGRSQYAAGALDEAQVTFRELETISPESAEAKYFLKRISEDKARLGTLNREKSRSQMLEEVSKAWQRPGVFEQRSVDNSGNERLGANEALKQKIEKLIIPSVNFVNNDLSAVVNTLSALSEEFDTSNDETKGVNLVLGSGLQGAMVPPVNLSLRNMSLKRILDIVSDQVGYTYVVQEDVVRLSPTGQDSNLTTEEFSVPRSALTRMTGMTGSGPTPGAAGNAEDPFAPAAPAATPAAPVGGESDAIRRFLQAAGVPFDSVQGSSLVYDGSRIFVTHTQRNLERVRNLLARYKDDIRQVEIEAKFIDVSEGTLDELGLSWTANARGNPLIDTATGLPLLNQDGSPVMGNYRTQLSSQNRQLANAFSGSSTSNGGSIVTGGTTIPINNSPPTIPGAVALGSGANPVAVLSGVMGEFDVSATLRALSQRNGSDLLSAPKITVLSGDTATITVAQELRYPQSYGEIQSEVGATSGGGATGGSGSAGVTITAGTPQDFTSRNVGVELSVTPTVDDDNYSITLALNPRVTEFEGYVEYGGSSVAVTQGSTVTVPSGFFQPIFATREIQTRVTVWDGATLVMGGLTREEVRRVEDKLPILGDIPFIGRAFKSKGEASHKRSLLIFVTANLVSPGGSFKKQELRGTSPGALFQNPTVVTPGGSESRIIRNN